MPKNTPLSRSKRLKWGLGICTAVYTLLCPFLFYFALFASLMISDTLTSAPLRGGAIMFFMFLTPLSFPISIYLMWSRYVRNQSNQALLFAGLPFYTFGAVFIIFYIFGRWI